DRWQGSIRFLRTLGDAIRWNDDRVALALFAHIAAPQIRLTRDPNTFFFFLDHLDQAPPFRIDDATTWDTNLELGIYWGLRLIERDEERHGKDSNAKMFVMLSDGESWSGEVAKSLKLAAARNIPLYVVGVGSLSGGALPVFRNEKGEIVIDPEVPATSRLDRVGLQRIALAGGGQYFEIDRESDRRIANSIVDAGRKRAPSLGAVEEAEELYWRFLAAAALFRLLGLLFLRDRPELWIQAVGAVTILVWLYAILWWGAHVGVRFIALLRRTPRGLEGVAGRVCSACRHASWPSSISSPSCTPPMAPASVDVALHADTSRAPSTDAAVRALVGTMAAANPLWGRLGFTANCASWASRRQSARCRGSCGNRSAARRRRGGPF